MLTNKTVSRQSGRFSRDWLFAQWKRVYSFSERNYLLALMRKNRFDICYEIGENSGQFIVPQLLPLKEPVYHWDDSDNLRFRYQYKFMPYGLMSRLIVRLSNDIEKESDIIMNWKNGCVLRKQANRALIEERISQEGLKIIDIKITGDLINRKDYLAGIRREIERIHDESFKNIIVEKMIPCSHCVEAGLETPKFFPYSELANLIKKGIRTNVCGVCTQEYSPMQLVYGVLSESEVKEIKYEIKELNVNSDKYIVGQAGSVGKNAHAHDMTFNQIWQQSKDQVDLEQLSLELQQLRESLLAEATTGEHYTEIGNIAQAETMAKENNGSKALEYLSKVSKWSLSVAEKIGIGVAIAAIKASL